MKYLTVLMLVEYIHLSRSTIYKMVSNNTIPHIKLGTRTLFDKNKIDRWMGGDDTDNLPDLPKI